MTSQRTNKEQRPANKEPRATNKEPRPANKEPRHTETAPAPTSGEKKGEKKHKQKKTKQVDATTAATTAKEDEIPDGATVCAKRQKGKRKGPKKRKQQTYPSSSEMAKILIDRNNTTTRRLPGTHSAPTSPLLRPLNGLLNDPRAADLEEWTTAAAIKARGDIDDGWDAPLMGHGSLDRPSAYSLDCQNAEQEIVCHGIEQGIVVYHMEMLWLARQECGVSWQWQEALETRQQALETRAWALEVRRKGLEMRQQLEERKRALEVSKKRLRVMKKALESRMEARCLQGDGSVLVMIPGVA